MLFRLELNKKGDALGLKAEKKGDMIFLLSTYLVERDKVVTLCYTSLNELERYDVC